MPRVDNITLQGLLRFKAYHKGQTESTCVANIEYDPESQSMIIEFIKRGTYRYNNVPLDVYYDFQTAGSLGKYFNLYIRDQFGAERIA